MTQIRLAADTTPLEIAGIARRAAPVLFLALLWCWETWRPFFGRREGRLAHAGRNLAVAILNTVLLGLLFGLATVAVAEWTEENRTGLLNGLGLGWPLKLALGLVLLDGWMYFWHRGNHAVPFLWRFHRMHHSDREMDVTTATRFHLGELALSASLRLGLVPLLGLEVWHLLAYDTLAIAAAQFHHADISLGGWDRWLRLLVVTPDMHKVHHSDRRAETDSNYSTVLSVWDRLFGSFRKRDDPRTIVFGLREFASPEWQGVAGMLKTPFAPGPARTPGAGRQADEG
ncbi:MAG: sterol desaturase family protein [Gemmataceae bacterium]|nr:sterol desaturase family protein [Gemmataceae bacterium]